MPTKIEYLDEVINPIQTKIKGKCGNGYHCTKISAGCQNCWAENFNLRFGNGIPFDQSIMEYEINEKQLLKPIHWRIPRLIGVQFMGDLFHPDIPQKLIDTVFRMMTHPMSGMGHHIYLILTKRPERILSGHPENFKYWKNILFGISICNQEEMNKYIPILREIPACTKYISIEPMLESIYFTGFPFNWVICGSESGPHRRPAKIEWIRSLRDQCISANIPFFLKQMEINGRLENDITKFPPDLQIREYPK